MISTFRLHSFDFVSFGYGSHLLTNNCNHFTTALALKLGTAPVPSWVNRLASIAAWFLWLLPRSLVGDSPVAVRGGDRVANQASSVAKTAAFSGSGRSLRDASNEETKPLLNENHDRSQMRERAARAALLRERQLKEQLEGEAE